MSLRLPQLAAFASLLLSSAPLALPAPGTVYLVLGSDTAIWNYPSNAPTTVDAYTRHPYYRQDSFTDPSQPSFRVMDPALRDHFRDSYGQPLKFTWWMMGGNLYRDAANLNVPLANTMTLHLMKQYHGAAIAQFGDELSLHYHTFFWSDVNLDGKFYWNQPCSFNACRDDFDVTLAQYLLEEEVFPVSFRSGWHFMDNDWQQYLNQLVPYSLHNDYLADRACYTNAEPVAGIEDWSRSTSAFVPFHPATNDYQVPGTGAGWNVRSIKMQNLSQATINQVFAQAAAGTDQVMCIWDHLPENFLFYLTNTLSLIQTASSNNPAVPFRYCTAVEGMQRWLGASDQTPPQLDVSQSLQGEVVTLQITASEPIFQPQPFVAVKDICEQYRIVPCQSDGSNSWTATLPVLRSDLAKVGIAVTDLAGNLTTRIIRYLPDDLYLDNLDPQSTELSTNWTSTTSAAWGTNARIAPLGAADTAGVRWLLPISNSGPWKISVQVPAVTNAAGNILFNVYSGGSNVLSVFFPAALPPFQWVYLGTPVLDQTVENILEMWVSGTNQPNTFAVADVLKLSPLAPERGSVRDLQVEPDVTTANVTWTTPSPTLTLIEYGPDPAYGLFSATNSLLVTHHVMTLTGLLPNTAYYFQIDSAANIVPCMARSSFTTARSATNLVSTSLFDITQAWKFTTNNLDGVNWQAPGYNDAAWPGGPGVLWVDTKYAGGKTDIRFLPLNTRMPALSATRPCTTYYFRTHFACTNSPAGATLTFSNYIDDGAAFYLNGAEINRLGLPGSASNSTYATNYYCSSGDATCPYVFTISGSLATNLQIGDNVLAVEVHSLKGSPDVTFASAVSCTFPLISLPELKVLRSDQVVTLYWNGSGVVLQQASQLGPSSANWADIPGPVTNSPYTIPNAGSTIPENRFFRIRSP